MNKNESKYFNTAIKMNVVLILIGELVRRKLLVPNADGIILVIPNEQVVGKWRLGIARNHTCGETTVSGFHIAVTVVDTDNLKIV